MAKKPVALDAKGYRKFGMLDKVAYAAGDLGCNMSFALKGTVQIFWLVYMMMETGLLSALLLVVQIWDAVNDPLIGAMIDADRKQYKRGKFKQYIFVGSCGLLSASVGSLRAHGAGVGSLRALSTRVGSGCSHCAGVVFCDVSFLLAIPRCAFCHLVGQHIRR